MEWLRMNAAAVVPLALTAVGLVGSAAGWAWAAIRQARTSQREQEQAEWERLGELIKNLYNKEGSDLGAWGQIVAVREFRAFTRKKRTILLIAKDARRHFSASANVPLLLEELDTLIKDLGNPAADD